MTDVTSDTQTLAAGDGVSLAYRFFPSAHAHRRGSVVYLHGIQSHGGWYVDTAAELARRGYAVYLPDRRGSGISGGARGFFPSWEQLIDDVRRFVATSKRDDGDCPTFLVGGCWGARPALAFALREERELDGLALVCPAINVKVDLSVREKLTVIWGRALSPRTSVRVPLTPEMFTSNPPYLDYIRDDPLSLRHVTASFFFETFRSTRHLARQRGLSLPLLLLQAGSDPIVNTPAVTAWFNRMASRDKQSVVYPSFGHILDFEVERQRYWDDLVGWLDRTSAVTQAAVEPAESQPIP